MYSNGYDFYQPPADTPKVVDSTAYEGPNADEAFRGNVHRIEYGRDERFPEVYTIERILTYSNETKQAVVANLCLPLSKEEARLAHPGMGIIKSTHGSRLLLPVIQKGTRTDFHHYNIETQAIVDGQRRGVLKSGILVVEQVKQTGDGKFVVQVGREEFVIPKEHWELAHPGAILIYTGNELGLVCPNFPEDYPFPRFAE
jgi:hypothetical protein